jgi:hypothetical protein
MDDERPEKRTVRALWADRVVAATNRRVGDEPIYLTLAGAEGRDIELLVSKKFLTLTETGSILDEQNDLIVAVESSPGAEIHLRDKFPGLKVVRENIGNVVRSHSPTAWPQGKYKNLCRALVVNLDLNSPLFVEGDGGGLHFPIIEWIRKFATLHAESPRLDWTLLLTLHGEITWTSSEWFLAQRFLCENFQREPDFATACKEFFGEGLYDQISDCAADLGSLTTEDQQRLLMAFVPKKLAHSVHGEGWRLRTEMNIRYGGGGRRAPIVTWIIDFVWDPRASSEPNVVYRESLASVLDSCRWIEEDGTLSA